MMPVEMTVRVRLYARDGELRSWLEDELALMSPAVQLDVVDSVQALADAAAELWIVGLDALTLAEDERLAEVAAPRTTPIIAIGTPTSAQQRLAFAYRLDTEPTSKQLKRAMRELIAQLASPASARPRA
jgi:hypothetical protein